MNILIITSYFPPDTTIAAVRPYMFAKHLLQFGHQVTVLRSGILDKKPDHSYPPPEGLRVISCLGDDSPAEVFERGGEAPYSFMPRESRATFLSPAIRSAIDKVYIVRGVCMKPVNFLGWMRHSKAQFALQKKALDKLRGERFDIVFATYGELENVWAGPYAAEIFNCKWILDLRDPIPAPHVYRGPMLSTLARIQDRALSQADACTIVADGIRISSHGLQSSDKVHTIYNGYEPILGEFKAAEPLPGVFSICYTGQIYPNLQTAVPLFRALRQLGEQGRIQLDRVRLEYAGPDFGTLQAEAEALHMEQCLNDHGYLSREEAARLQSQSDIFLVLSWNKKGQIGVLTGKFHEGIRAGKPILSIVAGEVPNSELDQVNQRFHYGFCYEESRDAELFPQLCDFLLQAYTQKMERGAVDYAPSEELSTHFRYDTLTRKLEALCVELVNGKTSESDPI